MTINPKALTLRQWSVLSCIQQSVQTRGFPPTEAEIGIELGFKRRGAHDHLAALERKGFLKWERRISRGLKFIARNDIVGSYIFTVFK